MSEVICNRCHNAIRHGRSKGLVLAFCGCLPRATRQKLMDILRKVEVAQEVSEAQYAT